jgi:protein pelota
VSPPPRCVSRSAQRRIGNSGVKNTSATGSVETTRVRTTLTIQVKRIHFSPSMAGNDASAGSSSAAAAGNQAPESTASLQISGPVAAENKYVAMGSHHTLDLEVHRDVRIEKPEWDSIALGRVEESCVPGRGAEVGAVVCGEGSCARSCACTDLTCAVQARLPFACFPST